MEILIDGRTLVPPEPLEKTLTALDVLGPDDHILLLLYCRPNPLFNILRNDGCTWEEQVTADGTLEIRIRRPAA